MVKINMIKNTEKAYLCREVGGGGGEGEGKEHVFSFWYVEQKCPWAIQMEMHSQKFWERS